MAARTADTLRKFLTGPNGLDPAGIREVRDLITRLAGEGVTVLLSSHLLAEVQQVCSSVTIIGGGRTLASGAVSELLTGTPTAYRVAVTDNVAAEEIFRHRGLAVARDASGHLLVETTDSQDVVRALATADVRLLELNPVGRDLESLFLELTADQELSRERHS